jgi:pimeloyl-ACP methyl ester carboxylesterase
VFGPELLCLPPLAWWLLNRAIRRGLRAPRLARPALPPGLPAELVSLPTVNGKTLRGWFVAGAPPARVVVLMHGWGGNAATLLPLAEPLARAGYGLLMVDARCHGDSDGDSFASLPRFAEDIEACLEWLAARPGLAPAGVALAGHSVGAGAALLVASRRPGLRAVLSLAAFAHPAPLMRRWLAALRIPYRPLGAYILAYVERTIGRRFDDIAPVRTIRDVACPVLLVHGDADVTVPPAEAREILAAAGGRAELLMVAGSHDDFGDVEAHLPTLLAFFERAFADEKKAGD